ncbi:MAG: sulfotransferase [Phycisphaerales bacterium]|nr:sulfotransferase [Phycisphaerales bacterium]
MKTLLSKITGRRNSTDHLNLLLCGGQRCGTSSLKYYLEEHPEVGFLNDGDLKVNGEFVSFPFASPVVARSQLGDDPATYRAMSARLAGKHRYIATKQPYFMVQPQVPLNLRDHIPDARLLFVLRDPVEATYSAYRHGLSKGRRTGTFESCIALSVEAGREKADPSQRSSWLKYFADPEQLPLLVDRGFYEPFLRRFYACLPASQILVLRFEELTRQTAESMRRILTFLDLDPDFEFKHLAEVRNAAPKPSDMNPDTRRMLRETFHDANQRLFAMLGWPKDTWSD